MYPAVSSSMLANRPFCTSGKGSRWGPLESSRKAGSALINPLSMHQPQPHPARVRHSPLDSSLPITPVEATVRDTSADWTYSGVETVRYPPDSRARASWAWWLSMSDVLGTTRSGLCARRAVRMEPEPKPLAKIAWERSDGCQSH
jgi:hypothetical protein